MKIYDLSLRDGAKIFGVSYHKMRDMCVNNLVPHARLGRTYRLSADDLQALVVSKAG